MPKLITCPYCGVEKRVYNHAETCGSGVCRMRKHRELKKQQKELERK